MDPLEYLKRNVFPGESGGDYNALYGYSNRPGGQFAGVNVTDMTVNDALAFSAPSGPYGQWSKAKLGYRATPMGAYQVVGTTLEAAMKGLGLTGNEKMTPELQDQIGLWIYQNQGPGAWEAWGKGGGGGGDMVTKSTKGAPPVAGLLDMGQMPEEDQGGLVRLLTGENKPWASRMNDIGAVLLALSGSPAAQPLLARAEKRKDRQAQSAKDNKTLAWLQSQGRDDLAAAVAGGLPISEAMRLAVTPAGGDERGVVVGGNVVNPITGEIIYTGPETDPGVPASFQALDLQAQAAGFKPGTPEYQEFMATRGAGLAAEARATGTAAGEKAAGAAGKMAIYGLVKSQVEDLLNDPYLPNMLGPVASRMPNVTGDAARVQSKMDQLSGGAFLQARELLKGGGAITDFESQKAESAFIRMNAAQNEADFRAAMQDFLAALEVGLPKLDEAPGGAAPGGAKRLKFNPETGELE